MAQRTHIPIIFESYDTGFFSQDVFDAFSIELRAISGIDFAQPTGNTLQSFCTDTYDWTGKSKGMTPFVAFLWAPDRRQSYLKRQAYARHGGKWRFWEFIRTAYATERAKFYHKLNKVLTCDVLAQDMDADQEETMWQLIRIFKEYSRQKNLGILMTLKPYSTVIAHNKVFNALVEHEILYHQRWVGFVSLHNYTDLLFFDEYVKEYFRNRSFAHRLRYIFWSYGCSIDFPNTFKNVACKKWTYDDWKIQCFSDFDIYNNDMAEDPYRGAMEQNYKRHGTMQGMVNTRKWVNFGPPTPRDTPLGG